MKTAIDQLFANTPPLKYIDIDCDSVDDGLRVSQVIDIVKNLDELNE